MDAIDPDAIDRDALERSLAAARQDPRRARQLDLMLQARPWHAVAIFASRLTQRAALGLPPYQHTPSAASLEWRDEPFGDVDGMRESAELLKRLLDAGLSRFEPSPFAALARAGKLPANERVNYAAAAQPFRR